MAGKKMESGKWRASPQWQALHSSLTLRPIRRLCHRLCVLFFYFFQKNNYWLAHIFLSDLCIPNITSLTVQILSGGGGGGGCGGGGGGVSARSGACEGMCDDFAVMQGFLST